MAHIDVNYVKALNDVDGTFCGAGQTRLLVYDS